MVQEISTCCRAGNLINQPIRVLIVDDSALFRLFARNVFRSIPDCSVIGHAQNGQQALEKIEELRPDLVTLDVEMPDLNGIQVLQALKKRGLHAKVLMLSRFTESGAQVTADALMEGAFDFVCKPALKTPQANQDLLKQQLESKLQAIRQSEFSIPELRETVNPPNRVQKQYAIAVIGTSTGGPEVLKTLLPAIPDSFPIPILIVQHIPALFSGSLAKRLNSISALDVYEAEDGMQPRNGQALVAPGGKHLKLEKVNGTVRITLTDDPPENSCRPAVDYTLRSCCQVFGDSVLAMILTGMGKDGLAGCQNVKENGGRVLAQHALGCTVFGMPKAVIEAGLADRIVKKTDLARAMVDEIT